MNAIWTDEAWEDYAWLRQHDEAAHRRVQALIRDIQQRPFAGMGRPEPLCHALQGLWSRRIDGVHRLVYAVEGERLGIVQCRYRH